MAARFTIQTDDLLLNRVTGDTAHVVRGTYTHRFMDAEDHDMVAHGMGEYAGVYGSAIDMVSTKTGRRWRQKLAGTFRETWENVTVAEEEAA